MASYDLAVTLTDWQRGDVLRRLGLLVPPVEGSISGTILTTNRDLFESEWAEIQNALPTIQALPNPLIAKASAEFSIRSYWDQPLGSMTTTQVQAILVQANRNLANSFFNADVTQVANYRSVINSTLLILANLPPTLVAEFTKERTALGLPADAVGATLAACQTWHQLLGGWIPRAAVWIAAAKQAGVPD